MSLCKNSRKMNRNGHRANNRLHRIAENNLARSAAPWSGSQVWDGLQLLDGTTRIWVPRQFSRHHTIVAFCFLSILFFPRLVAAAEWSVEPAVTLGLGADDNPSFSA